MNSKQLVCGVLLLVCASFAGAQDRRHVVRFGESVTIEDNTKVSDAVVVGGDLTVRGTVQKDAVAVGGSVMIGPAGRVGRNAVSIGGTVVKGTSSVITGDIVEISAPGLAQRMHRAHYQTLRHLVWPARILSFIGFLLFAMLVAALVPKQLEDIAATVKKSPGWVLLWCAIGIGMILPLTVLLAISIVGILFIPLEFVLIAGAFLVGYVGIAHLVGRGIAGAVSRHDISTITATVTGIAALWIIGLVPLLGWLVTLTAFLLGYGSVITLLLAGLRERNKP
jgi:hypothetical protein